jgi:hypothetical protein
MQLGSLVLPVVIAVVIGVLVLVGMIIIQRRQSPDPAADGADGDDDAPLPDAARDDGQSFSLPMRSRVAAWSLPLKLFVGSLVAMSLLGVYVGYQLMRTGGANKYISAELLYVICTVIGVSVGVYLKMWFDGHIGYVIPTFANDEGPDRADAIPFLMQSRRTTSGMTKVTQISRNRVLGLFWRLKLRGEDQRLRKSDKPLTEAVSVEIPEHGAEIEGGIDGFVVPTQKDGDKQYLDATDPADLTWRTRDAMSVERSAKFQARVHRLQQRLGAEKADNAQKGMYIDKLHKKLENEEYDSREAIRKDFLEVLQLVAPHANQTTSSNGTTPDSVVERAEQEGKP